ncbi:MAG TPA: O-antigen ligase family protein [Pseudonocardia sp.]|nr:O-antigen ligase family protein [Pseudonocardia sp.]
MFGLGTAIAYGALAQGAFHPDQMAVMVLAVAAAVATRALVRHRPVDPVVLVCVGSWLLFATWALLTGLLHGDLAAAYPAAVLAAVLAGALWVAVGLPEESHAVLALVVTAVAVAVAAAGWAGVALHREPFAVVSSGLWRASSTITYPNATAALLVVALFVALAVLAPPPRLGSLIVASVLFAGLLPSIVADAPPRPGLALAGVAAGLAVLVAARPRRRGRVLAGLGVGLAGVLAVAPAAAGSAADALTEVAATRLTAVSAERADLRRVTAEQFRDSPVAGVGPGRLDFRYEDHRGIEVRAYYTHNEYLQTAAETGLVGIALAVTPLGCSRSSPFAAAAGPRPPPVRGGCRRRSPRSPPSSRSPSTAPSTSSGTSPFFRCCWS